MDSPPRPDLFESVRKLGIISWSLVGTVLFLGALVWLGLQVSNLIPAVVLAIAIIYILNPVVNLLRKLGLPRLFGSCLSYLALLGILTLAGWLVVPSLTDQARDFGDDFPQIYDDLATDVEGWVDGIGVEVDIPRYDELRDRFEDAANRRDFFSLDRLGDVTLTVLEFLVLLIFGPVVAFYVLLDLPKLKEQAARMVPESHRGEVAHVARQLGTAVGGFIRGQLLVALIVGLMSSVGYLIIGLDFWLIIGMIAGFLNIIPFVGPWVGGALGVFVAVATEDPQTALLAIVVAVVVQQIDNHFISPNVLHLTVKLHPATVILALLIGGTVAGIWGVFLAVPVVAIVKIIVGHLWRTRVLGQSWEEASEALIEEHPTDETLIRRLSRMGESEAAIGASSMASADDPPSERGDHRSP